MNRFATKRVKKVLKIHLHINNDSRYMHNYCSKIVYLRIYTPIEVGNFSAKMCIFYHFFYFRFTGVSALSCIFTQLLWQK